MPGLDEFRERMKADADFAGKVRECRDCDALIEFAGAQGFAFSEEEIEALTDVAIEDIRAASGGVNMQMQMQGLVSGRDVIIARTI